MRRPAWCNDPATPSLVLFAALTTGGFIAIGMGWRVAARTLIVAFQLPALVSGAMGGLALIVVGTTLANIQTQRRCAAAERADTEALLNEAAALVAVIKRRQA